MKKIIAAVFGIMLLGGCKMKEFSSSPFYEGNEVKFTGAVEDRVNLWPVAYYREPVGSLAWPLISWGDDHLALRPFYSQYKQSGSGDYDEFNFFWPISQFDTKHRDYRVFPLFWGESYSDKPYFCLFPALWWNREFAGVFPIFWDNDDDDDGGFCVFPLCWAGWEKSGDLWNTIWPLYYYESRERSSWREEKSKFWAFCGLAGFNRRAGKFTNHRCLPFYFCDDGDFYSLPYSRYTDDGRIKSRILCGLAGCDSNTNGDYQASWLLPFYSHDKANDEFLTPLFGKTKDANWLIPFYYHDEHLMLTPLFGKTVEANWTLPLYYKDKEKFLTLIGGKSGDADWVVPFYWRDKRTFASLPYWRQLGVDGEIDRAFSLPLLSGYERDDKAGDRLLYLLMGLGGHVWNDATGGASWMFPLFYKDRESFYTLLYGHNPRRTWLFPVYFDGEERTYITPLFGRNKKDGSDWLIPLYYRDKESFITPLYGRSGEASWLFPLYCRDESQFNSPVYSYWDDAKKGTRGFFSLPLLSGANWETNSCDKTWFTLAGLVGGSSNASGSHKTNWALPLFLREEGESFYSIPFGWSGGGSAYTNTYFAAGLAGLKSGRKEGGWMFPLFNYKKDADFDEKESWLDEAKLPESVNVWTMIETNKVWNFEKKAHEEVVGPKQHADYVSASDTKTHLLVFDNDKSIHGRMPYGVTNRYEMTKRHKLGNKLVFNHESNRKVCFDTATREKISDSEEGDTSLLMLLYNGEHRSDTAKGTSYTSHRVLWKLWDWEEENGDVALDVFPGFTYDSRTNGYSKTSFLWRFFRHENDPEEGKKVDLLFIPVWR
ncbi:MAG: hypothetical protein E7049_11945 [Lentisphaerae bacterium]|nr:hypothetical protein [Lentisphaerota bacterium]